MCAWHLLLNPTRTRRMVVGSTAPLPDGWIEVASFDASCHAEARSIGIYLAPWRMDLRCYADPRENR